MSTENDLVAKCPQCGSMFRLTPQHLQAAKGWVQCGMCGNVFHSGIKTGAEASPAPVAAAAPAPAPEPAAVKQQAAVPPKEAPVDAPPQTTETPAGLSGLAQRIAENEAPISAFGPKLESIILVDPNTPVTDDDYGPMPVFETKSEQPKPEQPVTPQYTPATPPPGGWGAKQSTATSTGWIPRPPPGRAVSRPSGQRKMGLIWALLALILLVALAGQLVYFMRDKLAAAYPEFRPQLAQLCATLDCTLSLPRDTRQVQILGSDLQTENTDHLSLEITLANRAAHAMAWPVLELTLMDVEDQPVARRMFAPSEYLPAGGMEASGIQGRSEVPFNLQLHSKGLRAAGYRLRMFY